MKIIRETYTTKKNEVIPTLLNKVTIKENASMNYWRELQEKALRKANWRNDIPSVTNMNREIHVGTATGNDIVFKRVG